MKKLLLTILTSVLIFPAVGQSLSEQIIQRKKQNESRYSNNINSQNKNFTPSYSSGDYLIKSANCGFYSLALTAGSIGFCWGASSVKNGDNAIKGILYGFGGICGVTSLIQGVRAIVYIKKAGKARNYEMKNRNVAIIEPSSEGIGAKITF